MNITNNDPYLIQASSLNPLVALFKDMYLDTHRLLAFADISARALQDESMMIPHSHYVKLINEASRVLNCPHFGFWAGKKVTVDNIGPLGVLMAAQTNVANIYSAIEYLFNQQNRGARIKLLVERDSVFHVIEYLFDASVNVEQLAQMAITGYCNIFIDILGETWKPKRVLLVGNVNLDVSLLEKHFGCPVSINQKVNAIEYAKPALYENYALDNQVEKETKAKLASLLKACTDVDALVGKFIEYNLSHGTFDKASVAKCLGVGTRFLQDCLADKGFTYSQILEDIRVERATHLLRETSFSINEIAEQLGYSDSRVFIYAFKKWFNTTPLKWRSQQ